MKITVYNQEGKEAGQIALPKEVFEVDLNNDVIYQVAVSQLSNNRQVSAQAKNKSEVSGGGRKPWRQKGTGRARHGSIRSPLWKGGGVTFPPTAERNFKKKINKKVKKLAVKMLLSSAVKENALLVIDALKIDEAKTKALDAILKNLALILTKEAKPKKQSTLLLALPQQSKEILRAGRNIPYLTIIPAKDLNALALLSSKYLIMPEESVKIVKEILAK